MNLLIAQKEFVSFFEKAKATNIQTSNEKPTDISKTEMPDNSLETLQHLIDVGAYDRAEEYAKNKYKAPKDNLHDEVKYQIKLAQIYDYTLRPEEGLNTLRKAENLIDNIKELTEEVYFLKADIKQFEARFHMIQAISGRDVTENISQARELFREDLNIVIKLKENYGASKYEPKAGFRYLWLAKADLFEGKLDHVVEFINHAKDSWHVSEDLATPGQLSQILITEGTWRIATGSYKNALALFTMAAENYYTENKLYKGYATSRFGQAVCYYNLNIINPALELAEEAQRTYKFVLKRGLI